MMTKRELSPWVRIQILLGILCLFCSFGFGQDLEGSPTIPRQNEVLWPIIQRAKSKGVDLTREFELEALVNMQQKTVNVTRQNGDLEMVDLATEMIRESEKSGYFKYLSSVGAHLCTVLVRQDSDSVTVDLEAELRSDSVAANYAKGLNAIFLIMGSDDDKTDKKESAVRSVVGAHTKASANAKTLRLQFKTPKKRFHELLKEMQT